MKVEDIPHGNIEPDPENPNEMSGEMLEALKDDIRRRGFVQPVLVRPVEGGYRLIDGEHRWRVLGELGAETVPCVNRLRGKFVPVRLAHLLADIAARIEPEEIGKRLSMGKAELNDLLDMGGYEPPTPERPEPEDVTDLPDEPPETVEVRIVARTEQAEVIRDLLSGLDDSEQALRIVEACAQT
jgi:ParB-like chromosome segregation protein Spo0J